MATLSFHAPESTDRKIRAAAKKQGVKVSRYLLTVAERAAEGEPVSGLGRELEKLAIDGMALAALGRIRARATTTGADKLTPAQITASIKAARRARA
jgi:hypothetical protein